MGHDGSAMCPTSCYATCAITRTASCSASSRRSCSARSPSKPTELKEEAWRSISRKSTRTSTCRRPSPSSRRAAHELHRRGGTGNPNEGNGSYAGAMGLLYAFSYSPSRCRRWVPGSRRRTSTTRCLRSKACGGQATKRSTGSAFLDKDALSWISLIRQPDFVTPKCSPGPPSRSRRRSPSSICGEPARAVREGPCAQIMHKGPYDDEPATIAQMEEFVAASRMVDDIANPASSEAMLGPLDAHGGVPAVRLHPRD